MWAGAALSVWDSATHQSCARDQKPGQKTATYHGVHNLEAAVGWLPGAQANAPAAEREGGRFGRYLGSSLITLKKSSTLQAGSVWTWTSPVDTAQPASFSAATSLGQSQMPT